MRTRLVLTLALCFGLVSVASADTKTSPPTAKLVLAGTPAKIATGPARPVGPAVSSAVPSPLDGYQLERDGCCYGSK